MQPYLWNDLSSWNMPSRHLTISPPKPEALQKMWAQPPPCVRNKDWFVSFPLLVGPRWTLTSKVLNNPYAHLPIYKSQPGLSAQPPPDRLYVRELYNARNKSVSLLFFSRTEVYHIKSMYFGLTFFWFLRSSASPPPLCRKLDVDSASRVWGKRTNARDPSSDSPSPVWPGRPIYHPIIPPCDPFNWSDRLGENTSLCLTHVAIKFYILCTAPVEWVLVDGWSSRFAAGRNQAPSYHSSPSLHGNESEALDTASVDLTNEFQLVNTRPVSSWMINLWKEEQEAVQTMCNDFELLLSYNFTHEQTA